MLANERGGEDRSISQQISKLFFPGRLLLGSPREVLARVVSKKSKKRNVEPKTVFGDNRPNLVVFVGLSAKFVTDPTLVFPEKNARDTIIKNLWD